MTEPQQALVHAATDAMRDCARSLRERGWPVELLVDYLADRRSYAVSLRFELPPIPIPVEAEGQKEAPDERRSP